MDPVKLKDEELPLNTFEENATKRVRLGVILNKIIEERIIGSNGGVVTTNNIFKSVTSITSSGTNNGKIKIGTKAADGNWNTTIDANALNIDTQKEISTALLTSLRSETPTVQLDV